RISTKIIDAKRTWRPHAPDRPIALLVLPRLFPCGDRHAPRKNKSFQHLMYKIALNYRSQVYIYVKPANVLILITYQLCSATRDRYFLRLSRHPSTLNIVLQVQRQIESLLFSCHATTGNLFMIYQNLSPNRCDRLQTGCFSTRQLCTPPPPQQ
ncbi:unnamed protein product, partial [Ectocarpus sp. 12 AP-2014]